MLTFCQTSEISVINTKGITFLQNSALSVLKFVVMSQHIDLSQINCVESLEVSI